MKAEDALRELEDMGSISRDTRAQVAARLGSMASSDLPMLVEQMTPLCEIPLTLQRRIIHAVDGMRRGERVYVVFDKIQPYEVVRITPDIDQVLDCLRNPPPNVQNELFFSGEYLSAREYDGNIAEPQRFLLVSAGLPHRGQRSLLVGPGDKRNN